MEYYVNKTETDGMHMVHKVGCSYLPEEENRIELGYYTSCFAALSEAKQHFNHVNGCGHCSPDCHK